MDGSSVNNTDCSNISPDILLNVKEKYFASITLTSKARKLARRNQAVAKALKIFQERSLRGNDQNPQTGRLKIAMVAKSNLIPTTNDLKISHGDSFANIL
ncbi:MAG: hypothetical protein LBC11_02545 [Puniceicoccales bacterium]|jgi:hypothetical protein|nr:hypothetical protein [Puniceicoccales bacterium]